MNVRLGINPLTWSNDDLPSLGADIGLDTCLAQAAAAGYAGVELGHKFPRRAEQLGPLLAAHGLALVSGWHSLRLLERDVDQELDAMRSHLELLQTLGCEVVVCAEVTGAVHGARDVRLSCRPRLDAEQGRHFAERLTRLAERVGRAGMRLGYHHHMGTVIQSESDVDWLMQACGREVALLLDTGHLVYAGGDPAAVAARYPDRIAHVHCKDIRGVVLRRARNADLSFLEAVLQGVFTVPGDGDIPFEQVLAPLRAGDYRGWLVVEAEQDPAVADPVRYAAIGHRHLSALAAG